MKMPREGELPGPDEIDFRDEDPNDRDCHNCGQEIPWEIVVYASDNGMGMPSTCSLACEFEQDETNPMRFEHYEPEELGFGSPYAWLYACPWPRRAFPDH
jgi:hypothetical protein